MKFRFNSVCVSLLLVVTWMGPAAFADEWATLFDGKTLAGWKQEGGEATYVVKNGEIVGTAVPKTANSFLCTKKPYGDFILELEFKVDPVLNSGVQIRSHVYKEDQVITIKGKKKTKTAGTVYGYQVEIDPSERAFTGGIYDEARRGWLNPLDKNPVARKAFQQNQWNKFRIECRGDSIKTWINNVAAADLKDSMTSSGFIALQVHGVGKHKERVGKQVSWRNIRIQVLDK
ncbi:MAG TPA: DUF1080 domain-containing protein [Planctomycetaceae bacterium]|nr:DUF1080 domain-containing protein [Planctomycetaceae bacterium]